MILKERIDSILVDFNGTAPVLSTKKHVLFPQTGHAIEIRRHSQKQIIQSALELGSLFILHYAGRGGPKNGSIATLAYILESPNSDHPDECVCFGVSKVRMHAPFKVNDVRMAEVEILEDQLNIYPTQDKQDALFRKLSQFGEQSILPYIQFLANPAINTEMLANVLCVTLGIPLKERQKLLELDRIDMRMEILSHFMDSQLETMQLDAAEEVDRQIAQFQSHPNWN